MLTAELVQLVFAPLLRGASRETATQEFLAVPGQETPRWLLPVRNRKLDSVLGNWSPYRLASSMKWAAIRTAHRAGCLAVLPGVASVKLARVEDIDWRSIGWSGSEPPVPAIYVGTPGVSRKAVIHLVNASSGVCEAVVKVPLTEGAHAAILHEADVLEILADEGYKSAPQLIYVDRDRGVTTQAFIAGKAGGRGFGGAYQNALRSLMLADERTTIVGHAMDWREQLDRAFGCKRDLSLVSAAMSELDDTELVPACWVHGDFAPWNMRRLHDGSLALLDWEDAQRSGLPLQDAFHFFHMQDYLFGERPRAHAGDVERLARAIGIPAEQRRKLEIADLVHFYLRLQATGEAAHCEYLLSTLQVVLKEKHRSTAPTPEFSPVCSPELARTATPSLSSHIRSDLFAAVVAQLNSAEVPYCVLSGHENHAGNSSSDVDFMFHPRDMHRIPPLLARAAQRAGARLIQAIPHETSACYFVLAKDDGSAIGYFDPDSAGDYRRQGRLWLSAGNVLARRRRCKDLYVAAVPDEFVYYLIKKILKQSIAVFQLRRLRHLYQRDPLNCRTRMGKFWCRATVRELERALAASDVAWFQSAMPRLCIELKAWTPVEGLGGRLVQGLREGLRMMSRALHPTGMSMLVCGGGREQRSAIVRGLLLQLAPAFRRVANLEVQPTDAISFLLALDLARKVLSARVRSTLVVSNVGEQRNFPFRLVAARCPAALAAGLDLCSYG